MKKYIVSLLFISGQLLCMECSFDTIQRPAQDNSIEYQYEKKFQDLIVQVTYDNALPKINKFEKKLSDYSEKIRKEKELFYTDIKTKYKILDSNWKFYSTISDALNKFYRNHFFMPSENILHDSLVPQWFMAMLKKELIDGGCNPYAIHIFCNDGCDIMIESMGIEWSFTSHNKALAIGYNSPGKIGISCESIMIENLDHTRGYCLYITELMKHSLSLGIIPVCNAFGFNIEDKDVDSFNRLSEDHVILHAALKKADNVRCLKVFVKLLSGLEKELHKNLNKIDFYWKSLEWVKRYYTMNYSSVPVLLVAQNSAFLSNAYSYTASLINKGVVVTKNTIEAAGNNFDLKELLQQRYDEQSCCVCYEHPEDMRDIPCVNRHKKDFICRSCYNKLFSDKTIEHKCPLCMQSCFSYDQVTYPQ